MLEPLPKIRTEVDPCTEVSPGKDAQDVADNDHDSVPAEHADDQENNGQSGRPIRQRNREWEGQKKPARDDAEANQTDVDWSGNEPAHARLRPPFDALHETSDKRNDLLERGVLKARAHHKIRQPWAAPGHEGPADEANRHSE